MIPNRKLIGLSIPDQELMVNTDDKVRRIRALGIKFVRTDFRYEDIQAKGLEYYRPLLEKLRAADIDVLPIIGGDTKVRTRDAALALSRHAVRMVRWLSGYGVHQIQLWNEPNLASRFIHPEHYVRALKLLYPAIKDANPDVFCVGSGLATVRVSEIGHLTAEDWLSRCYQHGARGFCDAVAIHPYSYPNSIGASSVMTGWRVMLERFRPVMLANDDRATKVWITEIGFPTRGYDGLSEYGQRRRYAEKLVTEISKHSWIGPVLHYSLNDRGAGSDKGNWFGVYRPNGSTKPAFAALRSAVAHFS